MKNDKKKSRYFIKDGVEYQRVQVVADDLCSLNVFTPEEKKQIQEEAKRLLEYVEARVTLFVDWLWLLDKRIGN